MSPFLIKSLADVNAAAYIVVYFVYQRTFYFVLLFTFPRGFQKDQEVFAGRGNVGVCGIMSAFPIFAPNTQYPVDDVQYEVQYESCSIPVRAKFKTAVTELFDILHFKEQRTVATAMWYLTFHRTKNNRDGHVV